MPGGCVRMGGKHQFTKNEGRHLPTVFLGLCVQPEPAGRFPADENVILPGDHSLDVLPQCGIQAVPDQPGTKGQRARPHTRLPAFGTEFVGGTPLFAVGALLRTRAMRDGGVPKSGGGFVQEIAAFGVAEAFVILEKGPTCQHHAAYRPDSFVSPAYTVAPVAIRGVERRRSPIPISM